MEKAKDLLKFIYNSPTPYHAVQNVENELKIHKFSELKLYDKWDIASGGRYYIKINGSSIFGFVIGRKPTPMGITIVASHTDSPCLRIKPNPCHSKEGFNMLGVETYGGGIWHTWFDRDLGLAGKVVIKVPELAIHLNRKVNENMSLNVQNDIIPILSFAGDDKTKNFNIKSLLAEELQIAESDILSSDLMLFDCHEPSIGGSRSEFIFAPRLDNLFNVYCSLKALIESLDGQSNESDDFIKMILCYDHEEVGSESYQGAQTNVTSDVLRKICSALGCEYLSTISRSLLVSADQGHGTHPNFSDKHEPHHKIGLRDGVVLKVNNNQRYASSALTTGIIELVAQKHSLPCQRFVVRNDMPCGSTIGPIISPLLGIKTVDVGFPVLSMHSIRETCASESVDQAIRFYQACFKEVPAIMKSCDEN
ncbi:Aspartyl aminopeptidase [Thelohanellus kitauei]|uniref:Aspartyl aminopeptidase n=1 Tax=Thelohanellus kitauei TaxID=669202 RepID=A0A0C2ICZ5_THEKT|nr:Aspartyl aminopeptidase [Thelohanellus kitauei]